MNRSLILPIIIVAIIVIGAAVYVFFFRGSGSPVIPGSTGTLGALPSVGSQSGSNGSVGNNGGSNVGSGGGPVAGLPSANGSAKFGLVSNELVLAYGIDAQNNALVVEPDGKIALIAAGQANILSSSPVQSVQGAGVSYNAQKAFINFGSSTNPQTSIFTASTKAWSPLPAGLISPVWSPSDNRIAYLKNNVNGTVSLTTLDTSKATNAPVTLATFNIQDLSISWPNKSQIVIYDKSSVYAQGGAWIFNLTKKTWSNAVAPTWGFEAAWGGTTSTIALALSSAVYGQTGSLTLVTPPSTTTQPLNLATLPSKCAFNYETIGTSSTTPPYVALYCGVPRNINDYSIATLPDDYEQMSLFTDDDFYRIHLDSGVIDQVFSPGVDVDATNLRVANHILFFVNRYDNKLYAISLAQ